MFTIVFYYSSNGPFLKCWVKFYGQDYRWLHSCWIETVYILNTPSVPGSRDAPHRETNLRYFELNRL